MKNNANKIEFTGPAAMAAARLKIQKGLLNNAIVSVYTSDL